MVAGLVGLLVAVPSVAVAAGSEVVARDPVRVAVASINTSTELLQEEFDGAGLNVVVEGYEFEQIMDLLADESSLERPDIALLDHRRWSDKLGGLVSAGQVVPLRRFGLVQPSLNRRFGDYLAGLGSSDGMPYAIPASVGLKSLVWYPPEAFGQAGYQVPETWDEMMALSQQMVDNEQVPWCMAMGSEMTRVDSTGWVGTDWVEDIMLRTAGPDAYDAWTRGDLPFNSDQVRRAWELYGQVLFTEGFVLETPADILGVEWFLALAPLLEDPPGCWMHRQGAFAAPWLTGVSPESSGDVTVFGFPGIDAGLPQAALVGNDWAVVSHLPANPRERSELGKVIRFIASPRFGTHALAAAANGWLSAHRRFNLNQYPDEWTTLQAEYVRSAQRDGGLREDGSDQMPDVVDEAFFAGIRDYITGTRSLDQILTDIDTAWPE